MAGHRDDDEDDERSIARLQGYMRRPNERFASGEPLHLDWMNLERMIALAARAAAKEERESTEDAVKKIVEESLSHLTERLGIPNDEQGRGFIAFRKNQEWVQTQRDFRSAIIRHGLLIAFGLFVTAAFALLLAGLTITVKGWIGK